VTQKAGKENENKDRTDQISSFSRREEALL
jgi:hypothetical protein